MCCKNKGALKVCAELDNKLLQRVHRDTPSRLSLDGLRADNQVHGHDAQTAYAVHHDSDRVVQIIYRPELLPALITPEGSAAGQKIHGLLVITLIDALHFLQNVI